MLQCTGCGHVGWVEEKHLLCLHCLAHHLDKTTLKSSPKTLRPFVQAAKEAFKTKHGGHSPAWNARDYRALSELIKSNLDLRLEEMQRRWGHYLASPQPFIRDQGDSPRFFCKNFDRFIDEPLFTPSAGGKNGHGRLSIAEQDERTRRLVVEAGF
jgi:hypothetical protein